MSHLQIWDVKWFLLATIWSRILCCQRFQIWVENQRSIEKSSSKSVEDLWFIAKGATISSRSVASVENGWLLGLRSLEFGWAAMRIKSVRSVSVLCWLGHDFSSFKWDNIQRIIRYTGDDHMCPIRLTSTAKKPSFLENLAWNNSFCCSSKLFSDYQSD